MKTYFINQNTGILRAGWRILSFVAIFLSLNMTLMFLVRSILGSLKATGTIWFLILGISATIAVWINRKYISKKSFSSLGVKFDILGAKDLTIGILISGLIMATMYILLKGLGFIQFEGYSWWTDKEHTIGYLSSSGIVVMFSVIFQFTVVAWWEELVFRGVILRNISQGLTLKWGVIISTLVFALVHAGNPNSTLLSTVIIMIVTLQLVYAYLKSASLWLPIGLHLGWNFFQASIFGFASSGHYSPSLIAQTPQGPEWLSGGTFGVEHSIFIIPICLASFLLIHLWVKRSRALGGSKLMDLLVQESNFADTKIEDAHALPKEFVTDLVTE